MNLARILCLVFLLLEARGLSLSVSDRRWRVLVFYTQLSNLITTVSAMLLVVLGQPPWVTTLRYLSTCMLVMTFFVTTCVLIPMGGDPKKLLWSGNGLYHHVLCPILSTISYTFAERHSDIIWLPVIITLIYHSDLWPDHAVSERDQKGGRPLSVLPSAQSDGLGNRPVDGRADGCDGGNQRGRMGHSEINEEV